MATEKDDPQANIPQKGIAKSLMDLLSSRFEAYDPNVNETNAVLEDSPITGGSGGVGFGHINDEMNDGYHDSDSPRDTLALFKKPTDRAGKYALIQEILEDPTANEGLDIHVSYALSPDSKKNICFEYEATAPEHESLIKEMNARLTPKLAKGLPQWGKICAGFGINFVRPYFKDGVGITHFQSDYHTMPGFVRRYEKAGLLAGYTSQHLRDEKKGAVTLAPPWTLLEMKIPFFEPNMNISPNKYDGSLYSLFDEVLDQTVVESQDYGTSFLEYSFEPFHDFKEALESLRASRKNASRIDRFIATQIDNLDPVAAAEYINLIATQLKSNMEYNEERSRRQGVKPLINNEVLPVQGGGKGGVTIDTQSTDPNIQHLEDLMLHLRRFASSFGLDLSMLGWSDLLSGGLGEGGYLQTSIQAGRRSDWIRQAAESLLMDAAELDFYCRHKKILPNGLAKPWKVKFFSKNTAIEEQEALMRESAANFSTVVASLIDLMMQGSTNDSPTLKKILLKGVLDVEDDALLEILKELDDGVNKAQDDESLMSAIAGLTEPEQCEFLLGRLMKDAE